MRPRHGLAAWLVLGLLAAGSAGAQAPPPRGLQDLAVLWPRGEFRAPLICEIEGEAHRALRPVRIGGVGREAHRPLARVSFSDLEAPPGTRCHDDLGADEPNVVGSLVLTFEGRSRPDTADHDFAEALRRDDGFTYPIVSGNLLVGPPGAAPETLRAVEFKGGRAEVRAVKPGSDSFRRLADFGPRRKLRLTVSAPDGTVLAFDLVQIDGP